MALPEARTTAINLLQKCKDESIIRHVIKVLSQSKKVDRCFDSISQIGKQSRPFFSSAFYGGDGLYFAENPLRGWAQTTYAPVRAKLKTIPAIVTATTTWSVKGRESLTTLIDVPQRFVKLGRKAWWDNKEGAIKLNIGDAPGVELRDIITYCITPMRKTTSIEIRISDDNKHIYITSGDLWVLFSQ